MKYQEEVDMKKSLADPEQDQANGYDTADTPQSKDNKKTVHPAKNDKFAGSDVKLSLADQFLLAKQIDVEYTYSYDHWMPKREEELKNLKLYNNARRQKDKIGDTLLFTVIQTVLASLYDDKLSVEFLGREEGDNETAYNQQQLALYDYDLMDKALVDYDWDFDAIFFNSGLVEFTHFDRNTLTPIPEVIDPTTFLRDPRATSVNGNLLGRGAMRFGGTEIQLTLAEMKANPAYFNYNKLEGDKETGDQTYRDLQEKMREARDEAQNRENASSALREAALGENQSFDALKWYTYFNGQRCCVWLLNDRKTIVRYHVIKDSRIPIFERQLYRMPHDFDATSIPDLLGDKQRIRAIIYNAMKDVVSAEMNPMYAYNKNLIKNRADLNFQFNKHIGVNGNPDGAVVPLHKANVNSILADYILNSADVSAQKATATPEITQGVMSEQQRTLGEVNLIASKSNTRYSLGAKLFGISEQKFYYKWYDLYKNNFKKYIDEKTIRISGSWGEVPRTLTRENFISSTSDPDIRVTSKFVADAEKIKRQNSFATFYKLHSQNPSINKRYLDKKGAEVFEFSPQEVDRLYPQTADEVIAREENIMLGDNQLPEIDANDNHALHLEVHALSAETDAKKRHMRSHKEALKMMKQSPELFPGQDPQAFEQAGMSAPAVNLAKMPGMSQQAPISGNMSTNQPLS